MTFTLITSVSAANLSDQAEDYAASAQTESTESIDSLSADWQAEENSKGSEPENNVDLSEAETIQTASASEGAASDSSVLNDEETSSASLSSAGDASMGEITAVPGDSGYQVSADNIHVEGGYTNIAFCVWSESGGHDDEKWIDAPTSGSTAGAFIKMSDYLHLGTINVAVYAGLPQGGAVLVGSGTFEAKAPAMTGEITSDLNYNAGTVTLSFPAPENACNIQVTAFCITSPTGQVSWVEGVRQSDGSYQSVINLADFHQTSGTYHADLYIRDVQNNLTMPSSTDFKAEAGDIDVNISASGTDYKVTASPILCENGIRNVAIETYSVYGGADDDRWLDATMDGTTATCTISATGYKHNGSVLVNVYAADLNGKVYLLATKVSSSSAPSLKGEISIDSDNASGKYELSIPGFNNENMVNNVAAEVISPAGNISWLDVTRDKDSGLYVLDSDIQKLGGYTGTYTANIYVKDITGEVSMVGSKDFSFTYAEAEAEASDIENGTCTVTTGPLQYENGLRNVAIETHSVDGNGDDSRWLDATLDGTVATCKISMSSYKHYGTIAINVYAADLNGTARLVASTTTEISKPDSYGKITVHSVPETGDYTIVVPGFENESEISNLAAQIVNPKGGDIWLDIGRQLDNSYVLNANIQSSGNYSGTYTANIYVKYKNGDVNMIDSQSLEFPALETSVTATETVSGFNIKAENVMLEDGVNNVAIAIWTVEGGQDDIKWLDAKLDGTTASCTASKSGFLHEEPYVIDVYVKTLAGNVVLLGSVQTEPDDTSDDNLKILTDYEEGTYSLTVYPGSSVSIDTNEGSVAAAVWHAGDATEWYNMYRQADGSYTFTGSIKDLGSKTGIYYAEIYIRDTSQTISKVANGNFSFPFEEPSVSINALEQNSEYIISLNDVDYPGGLINVAAQVYPASIPTGEKWYDMAEDKDGDYSFILPISDFGLEGQYIVNFYGRAASGDVYLLTSYNNITVSCQLQASASATTVEDGIQVTANITSASPEAKQIMVTAWCSSDQSDLYCYYGKVDENGSATVKIEPTNHDSHLGTYQIEVSAILNNNVQKKITTTSATFQPAQYLSVVNDDVWGSYCMLLQGVPSTVSNVYFTVSNTTHSADSHTYAGTKQSNGNWVADLNKYLHVLPDNLYVDAFYNYNGQEYHFHTTKYVSLQNFKQGEYDAIYAGEQFCNSACGPTAVANIVNVSPINVASWMTANGYASNGSGTYWSGITAALNAYGAGGHAVNSSSLYGNTTSSAITIWQNYIKAGHTGILLMGAGYWTTGGHFITICAYDEYTDSYLVHDPASSVRDGWYTWDAFSGMVHVFYYSDVMWKV